MDGDDLCVFFIYSCLLMRPHGMTTITFMTPNSICIVCMHCVVGRLTGLAGGRELYFKDISQDTFLISGIYYWKRILNTAIAYYNIRVEGPVTVEVCLGMCEADSACLSVDYWKNRQTCKLGSRTPVTHQRYADNEYDLYVPCVMTMNNGKYRHRNSYQGPLIRHEHASKCYL